MSDSDGVVDRGAVHSGDVDWRVRSGSDDEGVGCSPIVGGKLKVRALNLNEEKGQKSGVALIIKNSTYMPAARRLWRFLQRRPRW